MTNVQQPEMRRSGNDPLVQDSKGPRPSDPRRAKGADGRPMPRGQVSPHGPSARPVAEDEEERDNRG
jgi:hypothetical protein